MRVIAGTAGGTRLGRVPGGTRPLSDRAREGLFASLGARVVGARCADLFAGTGAVGIEALSRGAEECVFVDASSPAIRAIRANLKRTGFTERGRVVRADVRSFLARDRSMYDSVFLDPPYGLRAAMVGEVLEELEPRLLSGATVAITRPRRDSTDVIPVNLQVTKRLAYGDTTILLLEAT